MTANIYPPIITLAGPTAVGKTELSIQFAEQLNAEIISADSRQVYRQLNIGTAKPDSSQLKRVPHHFINELDISDSFSAGEFARAANMRIKHIFDGGRIPMIVGGSTLYLQALQNGLDEIPKANPEVRVHLQERLQKEGSNVLYQELESVDPEVAATMDATKTQRLIRALEVFYDSGKPLSSFFQNKETPPFEYRTFVLYLDRETLYKRIEQRIDQMIESGLIEEVKDILAQGIDTESNALQTIGYREPIAYLKGEIDYAEMIRILKRNTRRYAKRQLTWFRRFPDYIWIQADQFERLRETIENMTGN